MYDFFRYIVSFLKLTLYPLWWRFDQRISVELFFTHARALISHLVADPALGNLARRGRHAFQGAVKCSLFPPTTQRPCRASSSPPAHLLLPFPTPPFLFAYLHPSSQDALCWGCGPCTYRPALSLTRASQHTHLIQFLHVPIAAAAAMAAALNRLHIRPSTSSLPVLPLFVSVI